MAETITADICYRIDPCTCGCKGRDPWHQRDYRRVIRRIKRVRGECVVRSGVAGTYDAVGWARLPHARRPIRVVHVVVPHPLRPATDEISLGWHIDRDDLLDATHGD